jgi:hypothetical protein
MSGVSDFHKKVAASDSFWPNSGTGNRTLVTAAEDILSHCSFRFYALLLRHDSMAYV